MTKIFRHYDSESRSLTPSTDNYGGQVGDSQATTLVFDYDEGFMVGKTAWIIFNVNDDFGKPLYYNDTTPHKFDGYKFKIPIEVTTRVFKNKLSYQLAFTSADTSGQVLEFSDLADLEIERSTTDFILIKKSTGFAREEGWSYDKWIDFFKGNAVVTPVEYDGKKCISFKSVNGQPNSICLNMPILDSNGKIPLTYMNRRFQKCTDMISLCDENCTYCDNSTVVYLGKMYKSLRCANKGNVPLTECPEGWWEEIDWEIGCRQFYHASAAKAIWDGAAWRDNIGYFKDALVVYGGSLYISLVDGNIGNIPSEEDSEFWILAAGGSPLPPGSHIRWEDIEGDPGDNESLVSLIETMIAEIPTGPVSWDDITDKPDCFPSCPHMHDISDVLPIVDDVPEDTDGEDGEVVLVRNDGIYEKQAGVWVLIGNLTGTGGAGSYTYIQSTPQLVHVINHNLNTIVGIFTYDYASNERVFGQEVAVNKNTFVVTFTEPTAIKAVVFGKIAEGGEIPSSLIIRARPLHAGNLCLFEYNPATLKATIRATQKQYKIHGLGATPYANHEGTYVVSYISESTTDTYISYYQLKDTSIDIIVIYNHSTGLGTIELGYLIAEDVPMTDPFVIPPDLIMTDGTDDYTVIFMQDGYGFDIQNIGELSMYEFTIGWGSWYRRPLINEMEWIADGLLIHNMYGFAPWEAVMDFTQVAEFYSYDMTNSNFYDSSDNQIIDPADIPGKRFVGQDMNVQIWYNGKWKEEP